ncbi:MAG: dTDP-4-dehydrorhamnose 3,5-epimerase family protein [candidate division NC10 bacterium]|nr:dTDP-4-dehydrorhamnose 3,5-epimerase family protein [candidate division NC10 bacterium]
MIPNARQARRTVTSSWEPVEPLIAGVQLKEVKNVVTDNGITTEIFRDDWALGGRPLKHIIFVSIRPGRISAWHCHRIKTDHIFVVRGLLKIALYDARETSPTFGRVNSLNLSPMRPTLVVVPPLVFHGVQNIATEDAAFVSCFDDTYAYDNPDDWLLPFDTPDIPFKFERA